MIQIDKYQVLLGNETVTLRPGESVYNSTWNTSPPLKTGEYYRGVVNVGDQTEYSNDTYLHGTDLAVTNLSVRSPVYDGDMVWVNATIENLGMLDATDFIVNFTEVYIPIGGSHIVPYDHLESIDTTRIEGLCAGSSINISVLWNASIRDLECEGVRWGRRPYSWTEYGCDDYSISVEIIPLENKGKEEDVANNTKEKDVRVGRSRDFKIRDLSFWVNNTSRNSSELVVYDDVTLNATLDITNLANRGGVVDVGFYIDDPCDTHKIGNTTVAFPAGNGTGYAEIEWNVDSFGDVDIVGSHNMTVVVDPENRIYEIDELNNVTPYLINVKASDPEVESLNIHPVNPARDETVNIEVTIANYGEVDAGNVTLAIYDWAERHIEDISEQSGVGRDRIEITRSDASAMKLYLDLEVENGCKVCVNDSSGNGIVCYHENFYGWTPWVLDNSATIMVMNDGTDVAYAEVSKIYYLESSSIIDTSRHDLGVNVTKKIAVNWTPPTVGERLVAAIIDPEDRITEHNKSNNMLTELVQVQTADLLVSNFSLAWHNGTEIGENEIVKDGDDVRISANVINIGVEDAGSFGVRFLVDDLLITNEVIGGLVPGESICVSLDWSAIVGNRLIKVEADYKNNIDEMNETNNIAARKLHVRGAELSGNTSWKTLGLHGEILFGPDQPYDEDEVNITVRITNSGYLDATDFNAALFFDYTSDDEFQKSGNSCGYGGTWINRTYHGAEYVYVNVTTPVDLRESHRNIIKDDVIIYDGNGSEVARPVAGPGKPCWVGVNGNTTNVSITAQGGGLGSVFDIYFYPIYQNGTSMLFEGVDVPVNSSHNLLMKRNVSAGDHTVMFIIDPENKVPEEEDHKKDNTVSRIMHVKPTRDFMTMNVTGWGMNLSDLNKMDITAGVSNIGLRNGTADVSFVDYEVEHRTYKYYFDINRSPSYLPIPPAGDVELLKRGYDNLMIIHRPGVDAIDLRFNIITLYPASMNSPAGVILICDANGSKIWFASGQSGKKAKIVIVSDKNIPVTGKTAYIYTYRPSFNLDRYTTETEFHREEVRLNASKTWNESKNITSNWTAYTGDHIITVTLDGDDKISEISESNNELSSPLLPVNASRDPAVVMINTTPEKPEDGDDVDITAVVTNNGYKNASFTVDLWANLTRKKPGADESLPEANLTTDLSGDRIRYITLLKHATVTLAPGENTTVNATWCDISIAGNPATHHIIAIVDPTDEIDEANESNNEIVKEITPDYPDLTVGRAYVHGGTGKSVVNIKEIGGVSGASDVTVRFESSETEKCSKFIQGRRWIRHSGANNMQVYFDHLKGPVEVKDSSNPRKLPVETYGADDELSGVWGPWVKGDAVYIICRGAGAYAKIDKYRWGNVSDTTIDYIPAGGSKRVEMPSWEYECPRMMNVTVDPDNNITELNEDNNEESKLWYADLNASGIEFVSPSQVEKRCLDVEKFVINGNITNGGDVDGIIEPVSDFDVTLEVRNRDLYGIGDVVFNMTKHIEEPLYAGEEMPIRFEFDPSEKFDVGGNYTMGLIVDSSGDVSESSDAYPLGADRFQWGESNNFISLDTPVGNTSGYTGGELLTVAQGEVNGRVVYMIDDSKKSHQLDPGVACTVGFDDVIPNGVDVDSDIEVARLFVYWYTWHWVEVNDVRVYLPVLADLEVDFNGHNLGKAGNYSDHPVATIYDTASGLYTYDVTDHLSEEHNEATIGNSQDVAWYATVKAVGLLVVYRDDKEPLTKYWINEGADVQLAKNMGRSGRIGDPFNTHLAYDKCIAHAHFKDVESDDLKGMDATLLMILGMNSENILYPEAGGVGDMLQFNDQSIGSLMSGDVNKRHWKPAYRNGISFTNDQWGDVTDHLKSGNNEVEMGSQGNYMMPSNAFLRLIFPPDLAITNLTAPDRTVVGAHHSINTTIRNDGRSDAHDFNVTFHIDGKQMVRIPHLDLAAGENMTIHLYNWTPMLLMHVYNLTAAADILSDEDWTEIETDNNAMTKRVLIEEGGFGNQTGPRGIGGGSNPTGGKYTEEITGRVMQGIKEFFTMGGGGGAGMFSLTEWIMKGAVWLVLMLFVCAGYRMEQRNYGRVSAGVAGRL
jgi:subtilase family serine protease